MKVSAGARVTRMLDTMDDGTLKVAVSAPPEKGAANKIVLSLVADHLGLSVHSLRIVSGHTSSLKYIEITV